MGTRIPEPLPDPDPVPPGDGCINCWGPGKPFGDGDTPEKIFVSLSGIEKGPGWTPGDGEPLDGAFELTQLIGVPCAFRLVFDTTVITVGFGVGNTFVTAIRDGAGHFLTDLLFACQKAMDNNWVNEFMNGSAVITIPGTT